MLPSTGLQVRRCAVEDARSATRLEAVCVACGEDLVVVVGGGARYHVGAAALAISIPSLEDPARKTNSSYLVSVPGHKEEELARDGSLALSRALGRHVVVTVGIHDDAIAKERIREYVALFGRLVDEIVRDQRAAALPAAAPQVMSRPMATTLSTDQLETLRRMLQDERSRILNALQAAPARIPSDDEKSELEETAQRSTERERLLGIAERERALLAEVERALGKLESGTYGLSEKSGAPIRYERLAAVPWARADVDE